MRITKLLIVAIAVVAIGLICAVPQTYAAHTGGDVPLKDADGTGITIGSSTPYSPKQTCMATGCHVGQYENTIAYATKDHGAGTATYQVPYPKHGVTAGYHFQQGRNLDWGDTQRHFYHVQDFTSSGGMYGKY